MLSSKQLHSDGFLRNTLVTSHLPLVKFVVDRIACTLPPHMDRDDLRSAGMIGLLSAAERFDPGRGVQFKTFAEKRISGSVMDEIRAQDWLTRGLREKAKRLEREFSRLEQLLGRKPTSEEVARAVGVTVEDYYGMLNEINVLFPVSLDDECCDADGTAVRLHDLIQDEAATPPQDLLIARQEVRWLTRLIDRLPERERLIVTLYYYEELNQKEIGAVLGVTESRVSQLHTRALKKLRAGMKPLDGKGGSSLNKSLTKGQKTAGI